MCRSCKSDAPKWGQGVKIPVKDLPRFFESQQSWNFEQKIYGRNVEVFENVRPTLTGRLGCRDTSSNRRENQFLVREIFHCPGWRYGCSPRVGCSGKRKNCYALCKVAIYSDCPEVGVVQYAGSHGAGNPSNPVRHRPTNRVRQFIRQQHLLSGATPAQLEYAIRQHALQEGLDINDPRNVPTSAMIRHIVKRARNGPTEKKPRKPKLKKFPVTDADVVSQVYRPIAVKPNSSPTPAAPAPAQNTSPLLSPPALNSSILNSIFFPSQLLGIADILLTNKINLLSTAMGDLKQDNDEVGSVCSLSPGTTDRNPSPTLSDSVVTAPLSHTAAVTDRITMATNSLCQSTLPLTMLSNSSIQPVQKSDNIWRPYLNST